VNEIKNINEFDNLFKEGLENTIATPPNGIWENLSSQIGANASKTIGKSILTKSSSVFVKTFIITAVASVSVAVIYQLSNSSSSQAKEIAESPKAIEFNTTESIHLNDEKIDTEIAIPKELDNKPIVNLQKDRVISTKGIVHNDKSLDIKTTETIQIDKKNESFVFTVPKNLENKINNDTSNQTINKTSYDIEKDNDDEIDDNDITSSTVDKDTIYKFFPNVITPNNDGINDVYRVDIKGELSFYLSIFNDRMEKIFETKNKNKAWECKLPNGDDAPSGTYYVIIKYQLKNESEKIEKIKLNLLR
jgi:gliding motility-associated-like protein